MGLSGVGAIFPTDTVVIDLVGTSSRGVGAIAQAEEEVPFEQTVVPADRLGPARRVREHARLAIGASQLELGA